MEIEKNLENIIKVKEARSYTSANKHMAAGWKLLRISENGEFYVLGWDKTTEGKKCREWDEYGWEIKDPLKEYRDGVPIDKEQFPDGFLAE